MHLKGVNKELYCCLYADEKYPSRPTMSDIQLVINKRGEKYELMKNISGRWHDIGSRLGLTTNQLNGIETNKGNQDQRFIAVMDDWICDADGLPHASKYPYSWTGLYRLLADSGVSTYAKELTTFMQYID